VTLEIDHSGVLKIQTNHQEAAFTVTGDNGLVYEGTGTSWSAGNVPDGTYEIQYGDIDGYRSPEGEIKELSGGGTVSFEGLYEEIRPESIVGTAGDSWSKTTAVRVFDSSGSYSEFEPFDGANDNGSDTVVGDIDGDGVNEVIVVANELPQIGLYDGTTGQQLAMVDIAGFSSGNWSIRVEAADLDLDADGDAEVVVVNLDTGDIRVFQYDYVNGELVDTGVGFAVTSRQTSDIAVGDVDGDGRNEVIILTNTGRSQTNLIVEVWDVGTAAGTGQWTATLSNDFRTPRRADNIAVMDVDGGGTGEILLAGRKRVTAVDARGAIVAEKFQGGYRRTITDIAVGDLDGDGVFEVVTGHQGGIIEVRGDTYSDKFKGFTSTRNIRVSTGNLVN
jgi:hypothetical protein